MRCVLTLCSWARHLTLIVPPSTQVFKWIPANLMLGVSRNTPSRFCADETGISSDLMTHLAGMQTLPTYPVVTGCS